MSWIQTKSGVHFNPFEAKVEDFRLEDIGHALSNICRFTGHVKEFYSVAQHSVIVSEILEHQGHSPEVQLRGLLHDASEAYLTDIARPLKVQGFMSGYRKIEAELEELIARAFGISNLPDERIKVADNMALRIEMRYLMGNPKDWDDCCYEYELLPWSLTPYPPKEARGFFFSRLADLVGVDYGAT